MKRIVNFIILITCISNNIFAQQDTVKYVLDVGDFNSLKVIDGVNVIYKHVPDSIGKVSFTTTADKASLIMLSNNNNNLNIEISTDGIGATNLPTIFVYSQTLTSIENTGDSIVCAYDIAPNDKFQARLIGNGTLNITGINASSVKGSIITGNGTLSLSGKCEKVTINSKSTGRILANNLTANEVKCILFGTGYMECNSNRKIMVIGTGSGNIYYSGNASDIKNRSLGIKISPIEENH